MLLVSGVVSSDFVIFKPICLIVLYFDDPFDNLLVKHMTFEELLVNVVSTELHNVPLVAVCQITKVQHFVQIKVRKFKPTVVGTLMWPDVETVGITWIARQNSKAFQLAVLQTLDRIPETEQAVL